MQAVDVLLGVLVGAGLAGFFAALLIRGKTQQVQESQTALRATEERLQAEQVAKATFEERARDVTAKEEALERLRGELEQLRVEHKRMEGEMLSDRRSFEERKTELDQTIKDAEQRFQDAFKALAALRKRRKQKTRVEAP